jgi:hypothetical protein
MFDRMDAFVRLEVRKGRPVKVGAGWLAGERG